MGGFPRAKSKNRFWFQFVTFFAKKLVSNDEKLQTKLSKIINCAKYPKTLRLPKNSPMQRRKRKKTKRKRKRRKRKRRSEKKRRRLQKQRLQRRLVRRIKHLRNAIRLQIILRIKMVKRPMRLMFWANERQNQKSINQNWRFDSMTMAHSKCQSKLQRMVAK